MTGLLPLLRRFRAVCFFFALLFLLLLAGGYLLAPAVLRAFSGLLPGEELYQLSVAEGLVARREAPEVEAIPSSGPLPSGPLRPEAAAWPVAGEQAPPERCVRPLHRGQLR